MSAGEGKAVIEAEDTFAEKTGVFSYYKDVRWCYNKDYARQNHEKLLSFSRLITELMLTLMNTSPGVKKYGSN